MNRTLRFTRAAPRQPTFSLLIRPHIARQRPPPIRWLATTAIRRSTGLPRSMNVQNDHLATTASYPIPSGSKTVSPTSGLSEAVPSTEAVPPPALDAIPTPSIKAAGPRQPQARFNEIKVQHISDQLHRQIFGDIAPKPVDPKLVELAEKHLDIHDLLGRQSEPTDPIGFEMPKLVGGSLDEHFHKLGSYTGQPWLGFAKKFAETAIPPIPKRWQMKTAGWTRYRNGEVTVDCPPSDEELLVFDVEVLYKISPYPVLACAASPTAWYSWISPQVFEQSNEGSEPVIPQELISLGNPSQKRIVIGHNVSYDRARIAEEYNLEQTGTFFLDTMSLHAAVNGMCSRQRPTWMKHRKNKELREKLVEFPDPELLNMIEKASQELEPEVWVDYSSINSLKDVAMFHCNKEISKETRDMMGEMTRVEDLMAKLVECLNYCAKDVEVTHEVYKVVLPRFLETCPHPVSFSALRHMGSLLLPVNQSWSNYVANSEAIYNGLLAKVKGHLESLTEQAASLAFGTMTKDERIVVEQEILDYGRKLMEANKARKELLGKTKRPRKTKAVKAQVEAGSDPVKRKGRLAKQSDSQAEEAAKPVEEIREKITAAADQVEMLALEIRTRRELLDSDRALAEVNIKKIGEDPWSDENAWLSQLDWSGREVKYKKQKKPTDPLVPFAKQKLPGYPQWYKDLFRTSAGMSISVRTRVATLMLRLQWDGYPLVWTDAYGWTFRVPIADLDRYSETPMVQCDVMKLVNEPNPHVALDTKAVYFKLPHNGGKDARCVNPLAKGYQRYFEDGVLTSEFAQAKEALDMNAACSYWISARERIKSQFVVWENQERNRKMGFVSGQAQEASSPNIIAHSVDLSGSPESQETRKKGLGLILPQIVTMGTITRRAVENTWLTASNAKKNRVGSELKAMIQAPPGYCFVGADVDSEELWIASLIGDAEFKMHGGNAIGFMTLEGSKTEGTDMHSRTASVLDISRNNAKVFNYGRIYGAGLKFAASLLRQFNPKVNEAEANVIAGNLYTVTKGIKTTRKVLSEKSFWRGGTESFVFNKLEEFAEQEIPKTPVLAAGITEALQKNHISKGAFLTSRINWAIQSSGVDYLHLLIVSMDYLIQQYKLNARLMITVHDEIRYIVQWDDRYKVAMALQVANIWTRSMFSQQMGINDLPQSCAFFSAVDIDHVLRKEVNLDCITPSNPNAIPPGESIDMTSLLAKAEAQLPLGNEAFKIDEELERFKKELERLKEGSEGLKELQFYEEYTARVPILEQLAKQSKSNIYQMRAQIAKDDKDLSAVIKDLKAEAPELMRQTLNRGAGTVYDPYTWADKGSDPWDYLNTQGRPLQHLTQPSFGWNIDGESALGQKPPPRSKEKLMAT